MGSCLSAERTGLSYIKDQLLPAVRRSPAGAQRSHKHGPMSQTVLLVLNYWVTTMKTQQQHLADTLMLLGVCWGVKRWRRARMHCVSSSVMFRLRLREHANLLAASDYCHIYLCSLTAGSLMGFTAYFAIKSTIKSWRACSPTLILFTAVSSLIVKFCCRVYGCSLCPLFFPSNSVCLSGLLVWIKKEIHAEIVGLITVVKRVDDWAGFCPPVLTFFSPHGGMLGLC